MIPINFPELDTCKSFYDLASVIKTIPNSVIFAKEKISSVIDKIISEKRYEGQDELEDTLYFRNPFFTDEKVGIEYFSIIESYIEKIVWSKDINYKISPLLLFAINPITPKIISEFPEELSKVYLSIFSIVNKKRKILSYEHAVDFHNKINTVYSIIPDEFTFKKFLLRIEDPFFYLKMKRRKRLIEGDSAEFIEFEKENGEIISQLNSLQNEINSILSSKENRYQFLKDYKITEIDPHYKIGKSREISELYSSFFNQTSSPKEDSLSIIIDLMMLFNNALDPTLSPKESKDIIKAKLYSLEEQNPGLRKQVLVSMLNSIVPLTDVNLNKNENSKIISSAITEFMNNIPVINENAAEIFPNKKSNIAIEANLQSQKDIKESSNKMSVGMKASVNVNKTRNKIRKAFRSYMSNEEKIDSSLDKTIQDLKNQSFNARDEIVEGHKKISPIKTLRTVLTSVAIFNVSKVAAIIAIVTSFALRKTTKEKEKKKIVMELEEELEIIKEKIKDADGDNDKKAKYILMRQKIQLEKAINRIKFGLEADDKSIEFGRKVIKEKSE